MAVREFDPKAISLICGTLTPLFGFADGDFVSIEFNEDTFKLVVGADGESTRTRSRNMSAKVTITLLHTSPANEDLNNVFNADLLSGNSTFPFALKDSLGRQIATAATAWITKYPTVAYGKDSGTRVWVIETDEMVMAYDVLQAP